MFIVGTPCSGQTPVHEGSGHGWDFGFWFAGATGEQHTNSFAEAQILAAGLSAGRVITDEIGHGWRRGRIEYAFGVIPLFAQIRPKNTYGVGFEPIVLRWKSGLHAFRLQPYIELAGGGLQTSANFPSGIAGGCISPMRIWEHKTPSLMVCKSCLGIDGTGNYPNPAYECKRVFVRI